MQKKTIFSKHLNREVTYVVKYSDTPSDIYLYFLDGQNIHDPKESSFGNSWEVENALKLHKKGANIIGIYSFGDIERVEEYLPFEIEDEGELPGLDIGDINVKGHLTGKFITEELIPIVESSKASSRLIGGASMGGVMSLYLGAEYPDIFDKVLAFSTAPFFAPMGQAQHACKFGENKNQKVYLAVGTNEDENLVFKWGYLALNRMLYGILKTKVDTKYFEGSGDIHSEISWKKWLPKALDHLLS